MPRHQITYGEDLKNTPEFQFLYSKWLCMRKQRLPHDEAFAQFKPFYNWSMANGYEAGATLKRLDESKPYSPANCFWAPATERTTWTEEEKARIAKWNETVNPIRIHFGLEPFTEKGES